MEEGCPPWAQLVLDDCSSHFSSHPQGGAPGQCLHRDSRLFLDLAVHPYFFACQLSSCLRARVRQAAQDYKTIKFYSVLRRTRLSACLGSRVSTAVPLALCVLHRHPLNAVRHL